MDPRQLLEQAKSNQQLLIKFQDMELRLLEASTLPELLRVLVEDYPREFSLNALGLTLFDWNGELDEFLSDKEKLPAGMTICSAPEALRKNYLCPGGIRLGIYDPEHHAQLFPGDKINAGSIALLRLTRQENDIGLLVLGSYNRHRYEKKVGTEFLRRLATITAICIENGINLERVRQLGYRDPLTRLYNRRFFNEHLAQEMAHAQRNRQAISCIYMDIDYFKRINDAHGHAVGDWVLCEVARRIQKQLRQDELLARIGGEEFAIILIDTQQKAAVIVAERIRAAMDNHYFNLKDVAQHVTISCGVAELCPHADESLEGLGDSLLDNADAALLLAKEAGRNRVLCANSPFRNWTPPP